MLTHVQSSLGFDFDFHNSRDTKLKRKSIFERTFFFRVASCHKRLHFRSFSSCYLPFRWLSQNTDGFSPLLVAWRMHACIFKEEQSHIRDRHGGQNMAQIATETLETALNGCHYAYSASRCSFCDWRGRMHASIIKKRVLCPVTVAPFQFWCASPHTWLLRQSWPVTFELSSEGQFRDRNNKRLGP